MGTQGRPIVSGNGSVTEIISSFVDHFLKELVPTLPSFIQDTTHFLNILENYKTRHLPPHTVVGTFDVTSLYTNIPHSDGLEASALYLEQRTCKDIPTPVLTSLMEFVLKNNNFTFNEKHYVQTQGTAMGTKMAPSYACLFMGVLEQNILDQSPYKPDLWVRFIDDIFVLWTHGLDKWNTFCEHLNSAHKSIKFVSTVSDTAVPFLDVEVRLKDGKISTDLYTKPTDSHNYLPWNSCHPKSTKKSIPYSLALRIRRICSEHGDFHKRLYQLDGYLRNCGYPPKHIKSAFVEVKSLSRLDTLKYRDTTQCRRVTFPIHFHPNLRNLSQTLLDKYQNVLLRDPSNKKVFKEPPMVAYRRPPNLRDLITRASITQRHSTNSGFYNCSNIQCIMHPYNIEGDSFTSSVTGKTYKMRQNLDCYSHNNIYLVTCTKPDCRQQYVGETGRRQFDRTKEHISNINNAKITPISIHFRLPQHTIQHLSIQIIERCKTNSTVFRRTRERFWQDLLKPQINKYHCSKYRRRSKWKNKTKQPTTFKTRAKPRSSKRKQ